MGISWESHGIWMGYQKMEDWWLIFSCFCPTVSNPKTIQKNIVKHRGMWPDITPNLDDMDLTSQWIHCAHTEIGYIGHWCTKKNWHTLTIPYLIGSQFLVEYANPPVCPPMLYTSMANWSSQQQTIPKFDGLMGGTNQPHLEVSLYLVYHITSHITKKTYQYPFISRMASHQS